MRNRFERFNDSADQLAEDLMRRHAGDLALQDTVEPVFDPSQPPGTPPLPPVLHFPKNRRYEGDA